MKYTLTDIKIVDNKKFYKNKLIPTIPFTATDEYIITTIGDRLDLLAYSYYKDVKYWRIIAIANSVLPNDSMFIQPGLQIRIPTSINSFMNEYNKLNKIR